MRLACAATDVQQPAIRSCSVTPPHVRWLISSTKEGDRLERCRDEDAALVIRRGIRSRWLRSLRRVRHFMLPAANHAGNRRAEDGRQPEQPELRDIRSAGKERRASTARRID